MITRPLGALLFLGAASLAFSPVHAQQAEASDIVVLGRGLSLPPGMPAYGSVTIDRDRLTEDASGTVEHALAVQWRYDDGRMLSLELNLGPDAIQVEPLHLGPVEPQLVFSHRRPPDTPRGTWPAWSARWTLGEEITQ